MPGESERSVGKEKKSNSSANISGPTSAHLPTSGFPPPPAGVCPVHLTFTTHDYCARLLFGSEERCYWHSESTEKYTGQAIESYFGAGVTLKIAIEAEVAAVHSLERAYLAKAPLAGSFHGPGCNLKGGVFVRANLMDARLSYSNLRMADFALANLESAYLSSCELRGAKLTGARLFNTKFRSNTFAGVVGLSKERFRRLQWGWFPIHRMLEDYPQQCEAVYRSLAAYFSFGGFVRRC